MKKHLKRTVTLVSCLAVTATAASLSACSLMVPALKGESGGGVTGTYTFDLTKYDDTWSDKVLDSEMWRITAGVGAYAKDTLVLNADGTYALTKEMGGDAAADEHWGTDGSKNFLWFKYFGTYTASGSVVSLSACTSIAVEAASYSMTEEYGLANNIEYTETSDLTFKAGTKNGELVVDLIYGAYIVDSGMGNVAQTVTLGTYDYGTFTFSGQITDKPDDGETPVTKTGYKFTSVDTDEENKANENITFELYADGTYMFAWAANKVSEGGAYTWDRLTQRLVLTNPKNVKQTVTATNGTLQFKYEYSESAQLFQSYSGTVDGMEAVICNKIYELIPKSSTKHSLKLYEDRTYTYKDATNPQAVVRETGKYSWDGSSGQLTLTKPADGGTVVGAATQNYFEISYSAGSSAQTFFCPTETIRDALTLKLYSFTPSKNEAITFDLLDDGTFSFAWAANGIDERGTWAYEGGELIIKDPNDKRTDVTIEGDVISFTYEYSKESALNQSYTGSLGALLSILVKHDVENETTEDIFSFTPGTSELITFTLYANGGYRFKYDMHGGITDYGVWSYNSETKEFSVTDAKGVVTKATADNGVISFTYNYSANAQLNQPYTGSVTDLEAAINGGGD